MGDKIGTAIFCFTCWVILSLGVTLLGNIIVKLRNYNDVFLYLSYFANLKWFAVIILGLYFIKVYKSLLMSPSVIYCRVVGGELEFSTEHWARTWPIQLLIPRTGKTASGNILVGGEIVNLTPKEVANYVALYEAKNTK